MLGQRNHLNMDMVPGGLRKEREKSLIYRGMEGRASYVRKDEGGKKTGRDAVDVGDGSVVGHISRNQRELELHAQWNELN